MKFDCGETREEKEKRLSNWHDFFCLIPRKVGPHDCRWLETIQRRTWFYRTEISRRRITCHSYRAKPIPQNNVNVKESVNG